MSVEHFAILLNGFIWFLTFLRDYLSVKYLELEGNVGVTCPGLYLRKEFPVQIAHYFPAPTPPKQLQNVMVNFMCQLVWIQRCRDSWQNVILECVCEGVLEEICIWIGRLNKEYCLHQCESSLTIVIIWSAEGLERTERYRRRYP